MAQPSFSLSVGPTISIDGDDDYGLTNEWATTIPGSGDTPMVFFAGGIGTLIKADLMWEVSPGFGAGLVFQTIQWNMSEYKRSLDQVSIGGQFRVNFTSNDNKVIPFFQGTFLFYNSKNFEQEQATSTQFPSQTQPAFTYSETTSVGFGANFGVEFMLGKAFGLVTQAGFHGTQAFQADAILDTLDYGSYPPPNGTDGGFSIAVQAGIKYYTGRGVKKRDF